jgi:hypothetical protein
VDHLWLAGGSFNAHGKGVLLPNRESCQLHVSGFRDTNARCSTELDRRYNIGSYLSRHFLSISSPHPPSNSEQFRFFVSLLPHNSSGIISTKAKSPIMHHPTLCAVAVALLSALPGAEAGMYTKNSPVLQVDAKDYSRLIAKSNQTTVSLLGWGTPGRGEE